MKRHRIKHFFLALLPLILSACANPQPPSGGPPDTTPPEIVASSIEGGTRNFRESSITLEFSEWVNKSQVPENVFLSPPKRLEYSWSGRELEITFAEPLDENTTYALTVGTNYTDLYGNNRPTQAYTIIFSTGDRLDSGQIRGRLFADDPSGTFVWVYPLNGINADTLNPANTRAKYRTQVGTNGLFEIRALPAGRYRVIAVRDQGSNMLLEPGEAAATAPDLTLAEGASAETRLRIMNAADITPPQLVDAEALNARTVRMLLSEEPDSLRIGADAFRIEPVAGSAAVSVAGAYIDPANGRAINIVTFSDMTDGVRYRLTALADRLGDAAGNRISDTANSRVFTAEGEPDTTVLRLLPGEIADSARNIPVEQTFPLRFTTALPRADFEARVRLTQAGTVVPFRIEWRGDNMPRIIPQSRLNPNVWHELSFSLRGLRALNGVAAQDTNVRIRFMTVDVRSLGALTGILVDSLADASPYVLTLLSPERRGQRYTRVLTAPGPWTIEEIAAGNYTIEVFQDRDRNGVYSPGSAFPFQPGERFIVIDTPVNVRPRWTVEGIRIIMPQP